MKTKTIQLFLFDELSKEQQAKAIENNRDINTEGQSEDFIIEEWTERLERQGFQDAKISYSGFWSQGDGASFSASVDLAKFCKSRRKTTIYAKDIIAADMGELSIKLTNGGHYCHEYTMQTETDGETIADDLERYILDEARGQARLIYKALEADYMALTSDEEIAETLRANEYYFRTDGEIDS